MRSPSLWEVAPNLRHLRICGIPQEINRIAKSNLRKICAQPAHHLRSIPALVNLRSGVWPWPRTNPPNLRHLRNLRKIKQIRTLRKANLRRICANLRHRYWGALLGQGMGLAILDQVTRSPGPKANWSSPLPPEQQQGQLDLYYPITWVPHPTPLRPSFMTPVPGS